MGAGACAVSAEKTERAIFSQNENTKQNLKKSMTAPCVQKQARCFGSGDEQIMQIRNSSRSLMQDQAPRAAPLLQEKRKKVAQQALVLNCKCVYLSSRRSYEESMRGRERPRGRVSPPDTDVLSESVTAQSAI